VQRLIDQLGVPHHCAQCGADLLWTISRKDALLLGGVSDPSLAGAGGVQARGMTCTKLARESPFCLGR
jgi:hypothetical protein